MAEIHPFYETHRGAMEAAMHQRLDIAEVMLREGTHLGEYVCAENNLDPGHYEDLLKKERQDKPGSSADKADAWARVVRGAACREI